MILSTQIQEEDEYDEDDYCVIIGRYIEGGCQVEMCENIDKCPYLNKSQVYKNNL